MEMVYTPSINPPLPPFAPTSAKAGGTQGFSLTMLLLAVLIGAAIKVFGPIWAQLIFSAVRLDSFAALSALLCALVAVIVLHEAGHFMAALLLDFEILGICIGPIRATRSHGAWSIQLSGKLFAGSLSAIPRGTLFWRERVLAVVVSGPVATLATGFVAALLLFHLPLEGWLSIFLAALVQLSMLLFVLGLIPNSRTAPVRNDARLFSILWKDSAEAREIFLYHLVTQLEISGVRPSDYPSGLIGAMAAMNGRPESMLVYAHVISTWALDRGDLATALAWDERALALGPDCRLAAAQATLARSACLDVIARDDFASARRKFAEVDLNALGPAWFRHRALATRCLVENDVPEALAELCRARRAFPKRLPCFDFEQMLLTALHRKALLYEQQRHDVLLPHFHTAAAHA